MKHPINSHCGRDQEKTFSYYFEIPILKANKKAFTQSIEEGTYIASHHGEVLNSKSEWHQTKAICTTNLVVEVLRQVGAVQQEAAGQGGGQQPGSREASKVPGPVKYFFQTLTLN